MSAIFAFVSAHSAVLAGLGVAILDLLFALNPSLAGNGILHQILVSLGAIAKPSA